MVISEHNKIAFISCVEVAVAKESKVNYNLVNDKLDAYCKCSLEDCYDQPECVKTILKEVYDNKYQSVLEKIDSELSKLENIDLEKSQFLEFMRK